MMIDPKDLVARLMQNSNGADTCSEAADLIDWQAHSLRDQAKRIAELEAEPINRCAQVADDCGEVTVAQAPRPSCKGHAMSDTKQEEVLATLHAIGCGWAEDAIDFIEEQAKRIASLERRLKLTGLLP